MADVTDKPQESSSDMEKPTTSKKCHTLSTKERKNWRIPYQSKKKERDKVQKIIMRVKLALQKSSKKRKSGKKPTILVCYHRQNKRKNKNQPKKDQEILEESLIPNNAPFLPRAQEPELSVSSPEKTPETGSPEQ
nr:uncharacterized protein LOC109730269 [Microcebus murinus]